jgi:hypothetical protein
LCQLHCWPIISSVFSSDNFSILFFSLPNNQILSFFCFDQLSMILSSYFVFQNRRKGYIYIYKKKGIKHAMPVGVAQWLDHSPQSSDVNPPIPHQQWIFQSVYFEQVQSLDWLGNWIDRFVYNFVEENWKLVHESIQNLDLKYQRPWLTSQERPFLHLEEKLDEPLGLSDCIVQNRNLKTLGIF